MPATAAARRVAATPARRATASRQALKPRPRKPQQRSRSAQARPRARSSAAPKGRAAAPARRSRRSQATPIGGFVPLAVGRTAGAVGGIADSGLVMRLTRGRLWIGLLGFLLVGIVAINVWTLSLNASSSKVAAQTDGLKRANSGLQTQLAGELSNERILAVASKLGLVYPEPNTIRTLNSSADAAALAAKRLAQGELTLGAVAPATPVVPVDVAPETTVAPVEETTPVVDPAATIDPAAAESLAPAPTPAETAGGVGAP
jgi:hypothetical protein